MSTAKYNVKRARIHVADFGTNIFRDVNTVDSAVAAFSTEKIEKQSTNEVAGVVAKKVLNITGTLTITFGSMEDANVALGTGATNGTQAAVVDEAFTLPPLEAGQEFRLPHRNISAVSIPGLVAGTDYRLFAKSGLIVALVDIPANIPACQYSASLTNGMGLATNVNREYIVLVDDILNGEVTQFFRWAPDLANNLQLISPNEFGALEVTGTLLNDESKPADGWQGQLADRYSM